MLMPTSGDTLMFNAVDSLLPTHDDTARHAISSGLYIAAP